ncbi:MAG: glycyl radical protein, partial [Candidatus Bathyarchaeota archaeon]
TDFYRNESREGWSKPILRARAFKHILENKTLYIGDGELLVGEKGSSPRAVPTYPELCCHSLQDLKILGSRPVTPYRVSEETRRVYEESIIPFWNGRDLRSMIFRSLPEEWTQAFSAGVFTEFMEQRAPGHAILDDKIYRMGLADFKKRIMERRKRANSTSASQAFDEDQELQGMAICCDAVINFASRYAHLATTMARTEQRHQRKRELQRIAEVCHHVPAHPPRTFWEALQMYWFIHIGVTLEINTWDSLNPGRLDINLYPFYKNDIEAGRLTRDEAKELLKCSWIKFANQPAPPKVDVTMKQSATYQDFATPNLGGVDKHGNDAVNDLSYLILEVEDELRVMQPNTCVQISHRNPDKFLKRALKIIRTGHPKPSLFNTDIILQEQLRQGKTLEEARLGGPSGCVTISAFGKETTVLTGYLNWVKILEVTLNGGVDPRTKQRIGVDTGNPADFQSFDELIDAFTKQLTHFVNLKIHGNNIIERIFAEQMPVPFQSTLIDDCIKTGRDYNNGGAKYNTSYIQGTGLGTLTDCLTAIKYHVFDRKDIDFKELLKACENNFNGSYEIIRQILISKTPKYGNDDDYADNIARDLVEIYFKTVDGRLNTRGGYYRINLLPTTVHIYFGNLCGATPDGRKAGQPISEGVSPTQGADREGPTAVMRSVTKWDHTKTGGTLLNMKFSPEVLKTDEDLTKMVDLIRVFFRLGGHHVQFNIIDSETLRDAQRNPASYRSLLVRVAGYSDYFVDLHKELQDEIISRTEHRP